MNRAIVGLGVLLCVIVVSMPGKSDEPKKTEAPKEDREKIQALMMRKLEHAQKLLAAITQNDQKMVEKQADALVQITKEPEWKVFKTKDYETYSSEFRRSAEQLAKYAKDKNLDGASLTYLELTLNCLNCHKYMRDLR
jgi:hypothetical protein